MITQFTVGCSRTVNLGNFESVRVESSVTVDVPKNGHADLDARLRSEAQIELRRLMEETYRHQYLDRKKIA